MASHTWYIVDADDGLVRCEPTKEAALGWCKGRAPGRILPGRRKLGPGLYEFLIGEGREGCSRFWICRADRLAVKGFDPGQRPLYPHADDPYRKESR